MPSIWKASFALLLIVMTIFFLFSRGKKNQETTKKERPPSSDHRLSALEESIGLKRLSIESDSAHDVLSIRLVAEERCEAGDLDAIKLDQKHSKTKKLIASVEALSGKASSFKPLVAEVNMDAIFKGGQLAEFRLPRFPAPTQLALFLCKDSENRGSCGDKPIVDINEVFKIHYRQGGPPQDYAAPDRLYFFQYLLMESPGSLLVFENPGVPDATFEKLHKYVTAISGNKVRPTQVHQEVDRARQLSRTINSLALRAPGAAEIQMVLPIFEGGKCSFAQPSASERASPVTAPEDEEGVIHGPPPG